jgi:hypothetical protein
MKTIFVRIVWSVALMGLVGCATAPGTNVSRPSPDELATAAVDGLVRSYEARDVPGFMTLVSARYLGGYEDFRAALGRAMEAAVSVDLEIRPERVREAEGGRVFMDARWDKTVTTGGRPGVESTSGEVTLVFVRYEAGVLKLLAQQGDPVFP